MLSYSQFLLNIPQPEQRSKEWYEKRSNLITSSNIGTILDLNPYKKSTVYFNELINGTNEFQGNCATEHGNYYENMSIQTYMNSLHYNGCDLGLVNIMDNTLHDKYDFITSKNLYWLAGSVDKLVWPNEFDQPTKQNCIAVENKCPFYNTNLKYGYVKEYYWPQLQFNMYILDLQVGDYIEMIPQNFKNSNFKMNIVRIYRDDTWIEGYALPKLEEFYLKWQNKKMKRSI